TCGIGHLSRGWRGPCSRGRAGRTTLFGDVLMSRHPFVPASADPGAPPMEGRSRVDLFEYQARDIFEKHGVPVLGGVVATTPEEARAGAEKLGGGTVVVKAQVKTGGRGKAGGVKLAHSPAEAE